MSVTGLLRPATRHLLELMGSSKDFGWRRERGRNPVTLHGVAPYGRPWVAQYGRPWLAHNGRPRVARLPRPRWLNMGRPLTGRSSQCVLWTGESSAARAEIGPVQADWAELRPLGQGPSAWRRGRASGGVDAGESPHKSGNHSRVDFTPKRL